LISTTTIFNKVFYISIIFTLSGQTLLKKYENGKKTLQRVSVQKTMLSTPTALVGALNGPGAGKLG